MKTLNTIDGKTLMEAELKPLDFVVDSLLATGLHILAGSPKVGKSWLALWLAVSVAKGEPVWGKVSGRGRRKAEGAAPLSRTLRLPMRLPPTRRSVMQCPTTTFSPPPAVRRSTRTHSPNG